MKNEILEKENFVLPVLPLRGMVLFPETMLHFDVSREKSVLAMNKAIKEDQMIFLVAQKNIVDEEVSVKSLCKVGVVAVVRQVLKQSGNEIRVLVEGKYRAKISDVLQTEPFIMAQIEKIPEKKVANTIRTEALIRKLKTIFFEYLEVSPRFASDIVRNIRSNGDPGYLSDYIASNIMFNYEDKQDLICEINPVVRLEKLLVIITKEIKLLKIEDEITQEVKKRIDDNQKEYFLREQMKVISEELGDFNTPQGEAEEFKTKILELNLPKNIAKKLIKECDRLSKMPNGLHEANVVRNYLETCLDLPWNKRSKINIDLSKAQKVLDKDHYGMKKVKERIIEVLAVKKLSENKNGQIICLVGPPGVGKTSIAKSVAKAIGCEYARISLGGVRDEADIRGHRRTYIGAMPGRIISALKSVGTKNPLILLDEIDKMGNDFKGDPTSALLEVLDSEQNNTFEDHYIDLPFDLSEVFFITTANDYSYIPAPLLDRMEIIELSSYTHEEKFNIAKKHLIPKQLKKYSLNGNLFRITDKALHLLIDGYTREAGVRNLEREIISLLRKAAKSIVSGEKGRFVVDEKNLENLLGPRKFKQDDLDKNDEVGVVNGLAWTSVGGETMQIEVAVSEGSGKIELTGNLGDVMKESAKTAITCVRTNANKFDIDKNFYDNKDIHIHVPEGAVPKDGPSAGIALATAVTSALTNIPIRHDVAMTGEITLRGRVLPIGGLKEKSMAAYRKGIKTVIIPHDNYSDLDEIDEEVKSSVIFVPVSNFDSVLKSALKYNTEDRKKVNGKIEKEIVKKNMPEIEEVQPTFA